MRIWRGCIFLLFDLRIIRLFLFFNIKKLWRLKIIVDFNVIISKGFFIEFLLMCILALNLTLRLILILLRREGSLSLWRRLLIGYLLELIVVLALSTDLKTLLLFWLHLNEFGKNLFHVFLELFIFDTKFLIFVHVNWHLFYLSLLLLQFLL